MALTREMFHKMKQKFAESGNIFGHLYRICGSEMLKNGSCFAKFRSPTDAAENDPSKVAHLGSYTLLIR